MRSLVLLALVLSLAAPLAGAQESHADCEEDQPLLLYRTSMPVEHALDNATSGTGVVFDACEGEQWDGQDPVAPTDPSCGSAWPDALDANYLCLGVDPNAASGEDVANPLRARVSQEGGELYVAANALFLARTAVYLGTCGAGEDGLEGDPACDGTRELRVGVYARDNTPGNIVVTFLECARWIICYPSESDCTYETYVYGQMSGNRVCSRDNTAFGVGLVLP